MEVELKFFLQSTEELQKIWQDDEVFNGLAKEVSGCRDVDVLEATYYDTADLRLSREKLSLRTRKEASGYILTLKAPAAVYEDLEPRDEAVYDKNDNLREGDNLYIRHEYNLNLGSSLPSLDTIWHKLEGIDGVSGLLNLVEPRELGPIMKMQVIRRSTKVTIESSLVELALDAGFIEAGTKRKAVLELELELIKGEVSQLETFGEALQKRYGLLPKSTSKFKDGLDLIV